MKAFMDRDFLLKTPTACALFHDYAEAMPIIDYHCHLSPKEIWENKPYENLTQVWLGGDHYKWRLMRCAGIEEKYITGDADPYEKFIRWTQALSLAIGNPLYHWSHLELRRFFGYEGILNEETAPEVWKKCNAMLQTAEFTPRSLIVRSNVKTVCTTDDPIDSLEYHRLLAADASFPVQVLPAWRPDKALYIEKETFNDYIRMLGEAAGIEITDWSSFKTALKVRMAFFHANGCRLSDHGLYAMDYAPADDETVNAILQKRLSGGMVSEAEQAQFVTACLLFLGREYNALDWAMQLHYGAKRNNNPIMLEKLGPDTGYDAINNETPTAPLADLLGALGEELPKTIVYSLNPNDDTPISSILGCFQNGKGITRVQHGSAWWFNDHIGGMEKQMRALASVGYLAGFVGMLTDSRSFLSYPRHEYFRRILCNMIGSWVEEGLYPDDRAALEKIIKGICYENARRYFAFDEK